VTLLREVAVQRLALARLEPVIGQQRFALLDARSAELRGQLRGRTIWNINSAAVGGGVAEMLQVLVGYVAGADIAIRWAVIGGDPAFFRFTKRLHNQIHGIGTVAPPASDDVAHYQRILADNAADLLHLVRPGDIALLHDPQTAGLAGALTQAGVRVVWRCHIGIDVQNDVSRAAWEFLRAYLEPAAGFVFTRMQYVPPWVPLPLTWIISPSIDPFSAKNAVLSPDAVAAILAISGVIAGSPRAPALFPRRDGTAGAVTRPAQITGETRPAADDPVVLQVSRWDRLKDMAGVMRGFAEHVLPHARAHLILAGPATEGVADDPEGAVVVAECEQQWRELPDKARERVLLAQLPMADPEENAAIVNALQRHATVVTQKSLAEGFGLTVAEAMWKGRPVVGSAVGGITDQIAPGTGALLHDPSDLAAFGAEVRDLLDHEDKAQALGEAGHAHTCEHFLADVHLLRLADLIEAAISG